MSSDVVLLAITTAITACAAVGVAVSRAVVRAAVWLLLTLIGVSLNYFLLGAEFLGAAQLIVYVGGTLVLLVFGAMMTNQGPFGVFPVRSREWIVGGVLSLGFFALLVSASWNLAQPEADETAEPLPGVHAVGASFLGQETDGKSYLLLFEILSVHLLVVLIAAAYLARSKRKATHVAPASMSEATP
jgi:NADH-quinone oxidoreductase subunit J